MQHISVMGVNDEEMPPENDRTHISEQVKHRRFAAILQEATGQNWKIENMHCMFMHFCISITAYM